MPLTGNFSFRRTLTGKVLLTVEEEVRRIAPWAPKGATRKRWRNASLWDLTHAEIRRLLEFRDGARPSANADAPAAPARPQREATLLDGPAWQYPIADESGLRRTNGH